MECPSVRPVRVSQFGERVRAYPFTRDVCACVSAVVRALVSLSTLFFLQTHHILPPIFSWGPSIFPEYSREYLENIPTENLPHTLVEQKNGAFEGEKGSPNAFLRDLSARNLSRMRNQQSTQLISCLDIINTK